MARQKKARITTSALATGSRGWTTDEQKKYLQDNIPQYLAAKVVKTTEDFWAAVLVEWINRWGLPALTLDETEQGITDEDQAARQGTVSIHYYVA